MGSDLFCTWSEWNGRLAFRVGSFWQGWRVSRRCRSRGLADLFAATSSGLHFGYAGDYLGKQC